MVADDFEPVPAKALDELVRQLRPAVEAAAGDMRLEEVLAQPAATQLVAKWATQHDADVLRHRGRVASWLLAALKRRGLGDAEDAPSE
jgi:hypothetical protein